MARNILWLLLACITVASAQEHPVSPLRDSTSAPERASTLRGIRVPEFTLTVPPLIQQELPFGFAPGQRAPLGPFLPMESKVDLTISLRLQMAQQARLRPYYAILQSLQLGAAGFLAVRYISKHGLTD